MKRILLFVLCLMLMLSPILVNHASADSLSSRISQTESLIMKAKEQIRTGDRTRPYSHAAYRILWIGYTNARFNSLQFTMSDSDRKYLEAVTVNFKKYVEKTISHALDITIDLYFCDREVTMSESEGDTWLLLTREAALPEIREYQAKNSVIYDTVFTTVQSQGKTNYRHNHKKPGYDKNTVMLGVKTHGLENDQGYLTFDLGEPVKGTYPQKNPEIPSLFGTAVAVHEWLHQLEYLGTLLGISYPDTHAYMGPPEFKGYKKITPDLNNYDHFEFYEQVLTGTVPYTGNGSIEYQGMYPRMWKLVPRSVLNFGTYTIQSAQEKNKYLAVVGNQVRLSDKPYKWTLRYGSNGAVVISSESSPKLRIDLTNASDVEGNTVQMVGATGALDAQRWILESQSDDSYLIRTPYSSHRMISVSKDGKNATINRRYGSDLQKWIFTEVK